MEWSHDLLSRGAAAFRAPRSLFGRLQRFDSALQVCAADLETQQALVEKSFVRFSDKRYWMQATIREFAGERLTESGELDAVMVAARAIFDLADAEGAPHFRGRGPRGVRTA